MALYTYSSLDVVGLIFLVLALGALIWSFRGRTLASSDTEASRALLDSRTEDLASGLAEDRRRVRRGGPILLAVFLVMLFLMALAPIATIVVANRAVAHATGPSAQSMAHGGRSQP